MSVLYFPQLSSGALAQYPITRRWSRSTTTNVLPDGSLFMMATPRPPQFSWDLPFRGLSGTEWDAIKTLFSDTQGRFGIFSFLDPTDNLLSSSMDFTSTAWNADPLLAITTGNADPLGGSAAANLTNNGQSAQHILQNLPAPEWFQYCFSIYLRANAPCEIGLVHSSMNSTLRTTVPLSNKWIRAVASGALTGRSDGVNFGLEIPAGTTIAAFGPQVEAQPSAGAYKPSLDRGGIYPNSRFDQDTLVQETDVSGQYSTNVKITAIN